MIGEKVLHEKRGLTIKLLMGNIYRAERGNGFLVSHQPHFHLFHFIDSHKKRIFIDAVYNDSEEYSLSQNQ